MYCLALSIRNRRVEKEESGEGMLYVRRFRCLFFLRRGEIERWKVRQKVRQELVFYVSFYLFFFVFAF